MVKKHIFLVIILVITSLPKLVAGEVLYFWSGGLTHESVVIKAVLKSSSARIRLAISTSQEMQNLIYSEIYTAEAQKGNAVSIEVTSLQPSTTYYYQFEVNGKLDADKKNTGSFTTFSNRGFSYLFVAGSCNFFPNNRVYDKMKQQLPLFMVMPGDLHYANVSSTYVQPHQEAYESKVLQHRREAFFYKDVPIAYVWDDHDYCGDNNDGTDGCGKAAYEAYVNIVPHYPLSDVNGNSIYQSFTAGRIRFVLTDLRSDRKNGDIMSTTQKDWFKNELLMAKRNNQLICWISSVSYSGTGKDNWGGYPNTRTEIANFLRDSAISNLFIISGDAHMLAVDNGTNADFSSDKNNPYHYPILQTAALNNVGSYKGGIYSEGGPFPNSPPFNSQWSKIEVIDNNGADIAITFTCYRLNPGKKEAKTMIQYTFCRTLNETAMGEFETHFTVAMNDKKNEITITSSLKDLARIYIYDYRGKLIHQYLNWPMQFGGWSVPTALIGSPGKYFIVVDTDKKKYVGHFVF